MTTYDYIEFIKEDFQSGKTWIEIKTDEPRKLYDRLRYKSYACKLRWHFQVLDNSLVVRPGAAPKTRTPKAKQANLFDATRPADGPRCKHPDCDKHLYSYEVDYCKCHKLEHAAESRMAEARRTIAALNLQAA